MHVLGNGTEFQREELIATILTANTPEQCVEAEKAIALWMQQHPKDFGILDAGESLAMMSERYDMTAEEVALSYASLVRETK